jgi:hypothetical protein
MTPTQAYVLPGSKLDAAPGEEGGALESLTQVPLDLLDATGALLCGECALASTRVVCLSVYACPSGGGG